MFHLTKVFIGGYKNIEGEYDFSAKKGYIALIGLNGSGKSNLLEAISIIFDCLINKRGAGIPFEYSVEYEIDGVTYKRAKRIAQKNGERCKADEVRYPNNVIACYSGEDKRLWKVAYESYHYSYFNDAVKKERYYPKILYINKYCWEIALLSILCSDNPSVKSFLKDVLGIASRIDVTVSFKYDSDKQKGYLSNPAIYWFERIIADGAENVNANLIATTDVMIEGKQVDDANKASSIFYFLYLLSQPKKNDKNKIEKLITNISINFGKVNFNDLSEGQKKLILVFCITKILGDDGSLILLDEPDAHTHISMTKDLLELISSFWGQIILTTHSPLFVKMIHDDVQDNLFYIENGCIVESRNNLIKKLSNDTLAVLDGSLYSKSNSFLLVEGKSDVKCIKAAIRKYPEFRKLQEVAILSFNSASAAREFFEQAFMESMASVKMIVFLLDYDQAGLNEWNRLEEIVNTYPSQCKRLFYQKDYSSESIPTNIHPSESILLEDLVNPSAYQEELDKIHSISSFHQLHAGGNITEKSIKNHIEVNCNNFSQEQLLGFRPLLAKLYSVFNY